MVCYNYIFLTIFCVDIFSVCSFINRLEKKESISKVTNKENRERKRLTSKKTVKNPLMQKRT